MSLLAEVRLNRAGYLEARPRPEAGRRGEILARFLQSDLQGDVSYARSLLAEIAAAERGAAPHPPAVGNAFSVDIEPGGAVIANVVLADEPPERFTLAELRDALTAWVAAIERAGSPRQSPGHRR